MLNKNDFKYILKRVIVFLIIAIVISFLGSCKAKAEVVLHPTQFEMVLWTNPSDHSQGSSVLSNTEPNRVIITTENRRWSEDPIEWGLGMQLNAVPHGRYAESYTTFNWPTDSIGTVFYTGILIEEVYGQRDITRLRTHIANMDNTYTECALYDQRVFDNDDGTKTYTSYIYKCLLEKQPYKFIQTYTKSNPSSTANVKIYQMYNSVLRAPLSEAEIAEIQQQIRDQQIIINDKLGDMLDTATDLMESGSSYLPPWFSQMQSRMDSNSVISSLVTLPITFLQAFLSGFNGTCQRYDLGTIYGKHLYLPCITLSNYLGQNLVSIIDVICSGMMIFVISKKMVNIFDDLTNLRTNQIDELYGGGA